MTDSPDDLNAAEEAEVGMQAVLELARRAAARGDILEWGKQLFPSKFSRPFCQEMHGYFVEIADDPFTNTEAPRARAKTTIKCFLIPIFKALEQPRKYRHYLNVQSTEEKALGVNRSIKHELESNPYLHALYGDVIGDRWTDGQFVLSTGVVFTAIGAGQSIRGINYDNLRPDYWIVDDLYDEADINNLDSTRAKNEWFWGSLWPARAQDRPTSGHVQGTAINKVDLLEVLKKAPGVKSKTFKAVISFEDKIVLWPELKNFDEVMAEKEIMLSEGKGSVIWFREYQNERRDDASSIVKRTWLYPEDGTSSWEFDPAELRFDSHLQLLEVLLGVDPSIGEKEQDDYTGIALVLKAKYNDAAAAVYFVMGLWNEHLSQDGRIRLLERIVDDQPDNRKITSGRIEAIGAFKDFAAEAKRRTRLPVKEIKRVKDKITNLVNKSGHFENRRVFLNKNIDPILKRNLVEQLTNNYPPHDDLRDGLLLTLDEETGSWADFV